MSEEKKLDELLRDSWQNFFFSNENSKFVRILLWPKQVLGIVQGERHMFDRNWFGIAVRFSSV